ncbi:MAG: hypothetical protein KDE51_15970 [Anaerolineales bacterium]|nr:hypothetical protein [Anaerolineales bacterium]
MSNRSNNEYRAYYNALRPHEGLEQQSSLPCFVITADGKVERRKILGVIINDYFRASDKRPFVQPVLPVNERET